MTSKPKSGPKSGAESGANKAVKLMVASPDDITMLSAFLQDGLVAHHDILYDKARGEVVMVVDRYRWEQDAERRERVLMGLRIAKVDKMLQKNMASPNHKQGTTIFYNLLNLAYEKGTDNKGSLIFTFSAGAALRIEIGELMMSAADIAPPRPAIATPKHDEAKT